jgi:translation initiation factor IF-1
VSGAEIIRLDARVVGVVAESVFRAKLANGHEIVVCAARGEDKPAAAAIAIGDIVTVELSPYDMATGRLVITSRGV